MESELAELESVLSQTGTLWQALPDPVAAMDAALEGDFNLSVKNIIIDILRMLGSAMKEQGAPASGGPCRGIFMCAAVFHCGQRQSSLGGLPDVGRFRGHCTAGRRGVQLGRVVSQRFSG